MSWLDSLENRFGRFAIPGLVRILVGFNGLVFLLQYINPGFVEALALDGRLVMAGQYWRLFTWLFVPVSLHPIWIIFALMFYWMMGEGLEEAWGSFRVNLYFLIGMVGTTVVAFVLGGTHTNEMLYLSLLFAFATLYPNFTILFMFILPIRIWWLAAFFGVMVGVQFFSGGWATRITTLFLLANYLLFFGPGFLRRTRERGEIAARRERFEDSLPDNAEPMHRCTVCGRTDHSDPYLEFRVGADGADYCAEHLPAPRR
jgi:hypothetical protein